ncbi:MAG TPA: hypothetical protein VMG60_13670 [Burkholderiaceae bacterium]|nr:hypothetical protein [Burkholderiaceae bacterium]
MPQTIEIRVVADDPAWAGRLECEAANAAGKWAFSAPGSVAVVPDCSALQITCSSPAGVTSPSTSHRGTHEGASTGAKVGAGAGVAAAAATASVISPTMAVLLVVGSAGQGATIGGFVGALSSGDQAQYPSPIVLHIKSAPPGDAKQVRRPSG